MYSISIIDRYYPPNPAISGEMACDMAMKILQRFPGFNVTAHYVDVSYLGGGSRMQPVGSVSAFRPLYAGRRKMPRLLSSLYEGYTLARNGLHDADLLISLSDPPMLCYWASLFAAQRKVPWIYQCMDCYPDVFVAGGLLGKNNLIYNYIRRSIGKNPPDLLIALGEGQAGLIQSGFGSPVPQVILPCGVHNEEKAAKVPSWREDDEKIYFGYVGNLGEAHSSEFVADVLANLDVKKHKLIMSAYGCKANEVLRNVKGHPAVTIIESVKREELAYIDIHLVSLLPVWTHVSVPSKAVSAICSESAIIFNGSRASDTWQMLGDAGWIVDETDSRGRRLEQIRSILAETIDGVTLKRKKNAAKKVKNDLLEMYYRAYSIVLDWIEERACR